MAPVEANDAEKEKIHAGRHLKSVHDPLPDREDVC
jgi:hypothetical protein